MNNRDFSFALGLVLAIVFIQVVGFLFPTTLTWGFHAFGFLPVSALLCYLTLIVIIVFVTWKGILDPMVSAVGTFMETNSYQFIITAIGIFILSAVLLKVKVPLLGDSFFIVKNFFEALHDTGPLLYRNEALATLYYFSIVHLFQPSTYAGFLNSFFVAGILLGAGFIVTTFFIVKSLFEDPQSRLGAFCLLLVVPYMQLFLGYVEVYGAVLFILSCYILISIRHIQGKLSFILLPAMFLLMIAVHYLTLLVIPSLLFLSWREWKTGKKNLVVSGYGIAIGILLVFLVAVGFDTSRFSASVPYSHILPLFPSTDTNEIVSTPYTLLSGYHIVDIINNLLLLYSPAVILFVLIIGKINQEVLRSPVVRFLAAALIPVLLFLAGAKFDLGAAKDWDVLAPYAFIGVLLAAVLFLQTAIENRQKILFLVVGVSLLSTGSYLYLNSTPDSSIRRYRTLLDRRTMSNVSYYSAVLHLALYYHQVRDTVAPVELWEQFMNAFPQDTRGYQNLINNIQGSGPSSYKRITQTYTKWLTINPQDTTAIEMFASFCLDAGNERYSNGALTEAVTFYENAIALDPYLERAYNNLGSISAQQGDTPKAIQFFQQAIDLDSTYSDPYYNLGSAYEDSGNKKKGLELKKQAARLGNPAAQTFLKNLGVSWQ